MKLLDLFDTGRMAHRFGKWRGLVYLAAVAVPLSIAHFIGTALSVLPGRPQAPDELRWLEVGLYALAVFLCAYAFYRLYRDRVHGDHEEAAERFKREGW